MAAVAHQVWGPGAPTAGFGPAAARAAAAGAHDRPPATAADTSRLVLPAIRWAFFAFVFSMAFEAVPVSGLPTEPTRLTGLILLAVALRQPAVCFRFPPASLWWFVVYFYVGVASLVANGAFSDAEVAWRLFVLAQMLTLFWVSYNLMRHRGIARGALFSLVASCIVLGALRLLGRVPAVDGAHSNPERFAAGLDPNQMAALLACGLLALVGLVYAQPRTSLRTRLLALPACLLIGSMLMHTGSRGGLVGLGVGLLALSLTAGDLRVRLRNACLVIVVMAGIGLAVVRSDVMAHRLEKYADTGSMTARERIYPAAWHMFLERPLLGWGLAANTAEIGGRLNIPGYPHMDAHNLLLYVLTATGLVGTIPILIGTGLCVAAAWRARKGPLGILPFAMVAALLAADMSVSGLHWKQHWVILAFGLASGHPIALAALPRPRLAPRRPGQAGRYGSAAGTRCNPR